MARRYRCPRPINRLITHRTRGLHGPYMQPIGQGRCVHTTGNAYAAGGGLAGPKAASGVVLNATTIEVTFTQCVNVTGAVGVQYQLNGGTWSNVSNSAKTSDTVYTFTVGTIAAGDTVRWRYLGGSDTIVDCVDAEDIGPQEVPVSNPLVLAGDFILLESGGSNIILLEDASDITDDAIALETRTP